MRQTISYNILKWFARFLTFTLLALIPFGAFIVGSFYTGATFSAGLLTAFTWFAVILISIIVFAIVLAMALDTSPRMKLPT